MASNGKTGNYIDALQRGDWKLPYGTPPLVVLEGGGNDAARGASDAQIVANAERLIASIRQRYPAARVLMVGTLARGAHYGGGRRSEVDTLLGKVANRHGLPFVSAGDWLTRYNLTGSMADGVHLNRHGHAALGAVFGQRLESMGLEYQDPACSPVCPANAGPVRPARTRKQQAASRKRTCTTQEPAPALTGGHRLLCCD